MPYAFGAGGTVLVSGRKYDLNKIISAAEQVVDLLAFRLDGGKATLCPDHDGYEPMRWPDPAKATARQVWLNASELYDGVYEALLLVIGPIKVRWYALGRAFVRYDGARDMIVHDNGKEVVSMDPEPCMVVYGDSNHTLIAAVAWAIDELCKKLGLPLWLGEPARILPDIRFEGPVALIRFPHERYGDGEGQVRIRCVPVRKEEP